MSTDYRAELQRLVKAYNEHGGRWPDEDVQALHNAVEAARTALAQPEPEEVGGAAGPSGYAYCYPTMNGKVVRFNHGQEVNGSRPLYAIPYWLGQPPTARPAIEPVPVAERLPGPEDCDEEGICWWYDSPGGGWYMDALQGNYSHWLPHNALPIPTP